MLIESLLKTLFSSVELQLNSISENRFASIVGIPPRENRCVDSPEFYKLMDRKGACLYILHLSSDLDPTAKFVEMQKIEAIGEHSELLSKHILKPVCVGILDRKTFAIYPYKQDFHDGPEAKIRKVHLRSKILDFLIEIAATSNSFIPNNVVHEVVTSRFNWLTSTTSNSDIQKLVNKGTHELSTGNWRPLNMLDHNDMWYGNILTDKKWPKFGEFYFIDWMGANLKGYGVHDILTFAISSGLSKQAITKHLDRLASRLNIKPEHLIYQYLLCMGELSANLNDFPVERFANKLSNELNYLK